MPIGYQQVNFHVIVDVNMEDSRRKDGFLEVRHVMDPPATIMYASVVLRETVRIALTLTSLNELPLKY